MRRLVLFLVPALLYCFVGYAQQEAAIWYFGKNAGLSFKSGSPVVLTDGKIYTDEGVASLCDASGNLLFYTEGTTVWNKLHQIMPNGLGLLGSFSSSQSSIIVPFIGGDPNRFYVFTTAQLGGPDGFNYSIVNMSLDNGKGDVETKNVRILSPVTEKLTAVKHCNGRDIWVIVHGWNSDKYFAYLVSPTGINLTPVTSTAGTFIPSTRVDYSIGCLKASPDGQKLAAAHHYIGADLLDFDNSTGIVSNGQPLFGPGENYGTFRGAYGVEFSPNSKLLYIAGDYYASGDKSYLLQYDVTGSTITAIRASKKTIYNEQAHWFTDNFGALQTGPDGRIYMAELSQPGISYIVNPNVPDIGCDFRRQALPTNHTGGGWSTLGLPTFIQSFFRPGYSFRGACSGTLLNFDYEMANNEISVKWDFGDPASGANNYSTLDSSQHQFTSEGIYTVKLIRYTNCGNDTISKQINAGTGAVKLGRDTTICGNPSFVILPEINGTGNTYTWQNGSTGSSFTATQDGIYWLEVNNALSGCSKRDSIELKFRPLPNFTLGNDLNKCEGEKVDFSFPVPQASFLWNNGSTSNSMQVSNSGLYWLEVSRDGCIKRDSITIIYRSYPQVNLGKDTILCEGATLQLDAKNPGMQFLWQNNSSASTFPVSIAGTYHVQVTNTNCVTKDTIDISYLDKPLFSLGRDTSICQGMSIELVPAIFKGKDLTYSWNTGSVSPSIPAHQAGNYLLTVTNVCGTASDEIKIVKGVCQLYVPSGFTPDNNGRNDLLKALYGENLANFEFSVFNRYGERVFHSNDISKGWNGIYKGQLQGAGVFVWTIRYTTITDATEKWMKGTSVLIR